ncbi:MAG: GNAT family N-acetyltransferase [Candidatus Neomarinimicrobiota bacterium]|nr:GNAT family N-acetyltransferase [Candidatus Neomarinimicrobiota bacterium]
MMKIRIILKKMSYENSRDNRILKSCLTTWFSNPKELHLTDPKMTYPFQFKQWMNLSYKGQNTETWGAFSGKWMVGIVSLEHLQEEGRIHLFHIYVDKEYRRNGIGEKLILKAEEQGKKTKAKALTLNIVSGNSEAVELYEKMGFKLIESKNKKMKMKKTV